MEVDEVGFMVKVGKDETADLVEAMGTIEVVMGLYLGSLELV